MSVVDTSVLSMSISKNESQIIDDEDDDTATAQTDREMFFHVVEYRQDIYEYMKEIEVNLFQNHKFIVLYNIKHTKLKIKFILQLVKGTNT